MSERKIAYSGGNLGTDCKQDEIDIFELIRRMKSKPCSFLSEMDILAVTHYLEINIETFFELKWAFISLFVA